MLDTFADFLALFPIAWIVIFGHTVFTFDPAEGDSEVHGELVELHGLFADKLDRVGYVFIIANLLVVGFRGLLWTLFGSEVELLGLAGSRGSMEVELEVGEGFDKEE